jgi:hypothetical protein
VSALWNVLVAPDAAFDELRERPAWVFALLACMVVTTITQFLSLPALQHAFIASFPAQLAHDPNAASMTPDQRKHAMDFALGILRVGPFISGIVAPVVAVLVTAIVLLAAAAIGRGTVSFARLFALAANVAIVWFVLAQIVITAIVLARGATSYEATWELYLAMPSLAWIAPGAPPKVLAFLSGVNPFSIWSLVLLGRGTARIARIAPWPAYAAATAVTLCSCLFVTLAVR